MFPEEARTYIDAERLREADQIAREEYAKAEGEARGKAEDRGGIVEAVLNALILRFPNEARQVDVWQERIGKHSNDELLKGLNILLRNQNFNEFASVLY